MNREIFGQDAVLFPRGKFMKATFLPRKMSGLIINSHVKEESEKLSVFQQGGVYLATKKIGKNNPREAEIRADNAVRQEWNEMRTLMEKL